MSKNPITGVGVSGYTFVLSELKPDQRVWAYQPIHNSFLLILAEVGLLGLLALLRV
ncbi:O-antigen ligase family protein [Patescibacteria group bacterium]